MHYAMTTDAKHRQVGNSSDTVGEQLFDWSLVMSYNAAIPFGRQFCIGLEATILTIQLAPLRLPTHREDPAVRARARQTPFVTAPPAPFDASDPLLEFAPVPYVAPRKNPVAPDRQRNPSTGSGQD